jgi:hypothetical protein
MMFMDIIDPDDATYLPPLPDLPRDRAQRRHSDDQQLRWLLDFAYRTLPAHEAPARQLYTQLRDVIHIAAGHRWLVSGEGQEFGGVRQRDGEEIRVLDSRGHERIRRASREKRERLSLSRLREAQLLVKNTLKGLTSGAIVVHRLDNVTVSAFGHAQAFHAPLPTAALIATLTLLDRVGLKGIRRCAYGYVKGQPGSNCGRVFVAVKRQKYCRAHKKVARAEQLEKARSKHRNKSKRSP